MIRPGEKVWVPYVEDKEGNVFFLSTISSEDEDKARIHVETQARSIFRMFSKIVKVGYAEFDIDPKSFTPVISRDKFNQSQGPTP